MLTITKLNQGWKHLDVDIINKENIDSSHLSKKGLHLNINGTGKLALNFIKQICKIH